MGKGDRFTAQAALLSSAVSSNDRAAHLSDAAMQCVSTTPSSEAERAPATDAIQLIRSSSEAARTPTTGVAATWLDPGRPPVRVRLTRDGKVVYGQGQPHGLAARVADGQLLLCFHFSGDDRLAVPHVLRPVAVDKDVFAWRTNDAKEVLLLHSALGGAALPPLANESPKKGLWFAPGRPPARAELAPGGVATVGNAVAWWGLGQPSAAKAAVIVFMIRAFRGDEPVVLRELAPGIWRCAAHRFVLVDDEAPPPRLQPSDLPQFILQERIHRSLFWLHPGRAAQTVSLLKDGRVAWAVVGGRVFGPANGKWESREDGGQEYLSVNFTALGEETQLYSTLLKPVDLGPPLAWHAAGSVAPTGVLQHDDPYELADWHVVALDSQLPLKRPAQAAIEAC